MMPVPTWYQQILFLLIHGFGSPSRSWFGIAPRWLGRRRCPRPTIHRRQGLPMILPWVVHFGVGPWWIIHTAIKTDRCMWPVPPLLLLTCVLRCFCCYNTTILLYNTTAANESVMQLLLRSLHFTFSSRWSSRYRWTATTFMESLGTHL
jgi:hypothetical protein